mgnify:CR=1 FL=1
MGNEQAGGTSHHFQNDDNQLSKRGSLLWTKNGRIPLSKQVKPSWHLARDVSMDILSRKATKLNVKAGRTPVNSMYCSYLDFFFVESQMSIYAKQKMTLKKFPMQPPAPGKPLPTYRVPRMPTEKEVADVKIHFFCFLNLHQTNFFRKITVAYQLLCEFCGGPCIGEYVRCRVCIKSYHARCVYERGYNYDQLLTIARLSRQDWSCPDCVKQKYETFHI